VSAILPGSTIGVLGAGQLGRMFALAARRLGYHVHTFSPESGTPTGEVADEEISAPYEDLDAIARFARGVDVVTFEFENVPAAAAAAAEEHAIVRPSGRALAVAQHRLREKTFVASLGVAVTPFAPVRSEAELASAVAAIGGPAILKSAVLGYDGKGQAAIETPDAAAAAWSAIGRAEAILEARIDLDCEISVIGARGVGGESSWFGPIENVHRRHILDVSSAPADVSADIAALAVDVTRRVMDALDLVGLLCIEFFVARDGRLLVNELAPRPHNSGHLTIDACRTSQFEQQLRAVCGLPLGSPELLQPAAMANLLGELWEHGEPDWRSTLAHSDVKLHLYGKAVPRAGRKMGHLTALAPTASHAKARVLDARDALVPVTLETDRRR
jgi:5-(carboxyamino)imidazole ribonucleotide synthase